MMKKFLFPALLLMACSRPGSTEVPQTVLQAFEDHFKDVKAKSWEAENDSTYEAEFQLNQKPYSASFHKNGTLLEIEQEVSRDELPEAVFAYISAQYPGFKITETSKITDAEGTLSFEAELTRDKQRFDLLFNAQGRFLSKESEANEKAEDD